MMTRMRGDESGLTLIELLVAAAMSVVIVGAGASMMISAVRKQPELSEESQKVSEVRYVQERMTKELRNGVRVDEATPTTVSFVTRVRTTACGAGVSLDPGVPATNCQVTYDCSDGSTCTRAEAAEGVVGGGTPKPLIGELESGGVFNYFPNKEEPTYVGIVFRVSNPSDSPALTVSDGASLRTPVLLSSG
jgi:type II secretory pathway pseudopilin PulG